MFTTPLMPFSNYLVLLNLSIFLKATWSMARYWCMLPLAFSHGIASHSQIMCTHCDFYFTIPYAQWFYTRRVLYEGGSSPAASHSWLLITSADSRCASSIRSSLLLSLSSFSSSPLSSSHFHQHHQRIYSFPSYIYLMAPSTQAASCKHFLWYIRLPTFPLHCWTSLLCAGILPVPSYSKGLIYPSMQVTTSLTLHEGTYIHS